MNEDWNKLNDTEFKQAYQEAYNNHPHDHEGLSARGFPRRFFGGKLGLKKRLEKYYLSLNCEHRFIRRYIENRHKIFRESTCEICGIIKITQGFACEISLFN